MSTLTAGHVGRPSETAEPAEPDEPIDDAGTGATAGEPTDTADELSGDVREDAAAEEGEGPADIDREQAEDPGPVESVGSGIDGSEIARSAETGSGDAGVEAAGTDYTGTDDTGTDDTGTDDTESGDTDGSETGHTETGNTETGHTGTGDTETAGTTDTGSGATGSQAAGSDEAGDRTGDDEAGDDEAGDDEAGDPAPESAAPVVGPPTGETPVVGEVALALRRDFGAHLEENYQRLVAQLYAITLDAGEAHDAVQDAYSRAWRRWSELHRSPDPAGWVRRVAVRSTTGSRRWILAALGRGPATRPLPEDTDPRTRAVLEALGRLTAAQRRAAVLHHMAGVHADEIALLEKVPLATVRRRLAEAEEVLVMGMADVLPEILGLIDEVSY